MPELAINKDGKTLVELWDYDGCGIVIESPTGIVYTNQAGGSLCDHPEAEGFFFPLNDRRPEAWGRLHELLCGFSWNDESIIEPKAIWVIEDEILPAFVLVDGSRLKNGEEAWIPVIFEDRRTGWLTYPNCD